VTYQLNTGIPDDLAADLKSYADTRGISVAAAVRILLHDALNGKEKP
jgi:plasmid stability protein